MRAPISLCWQSFLLDTFLEVGENDMYARFFMLTQFAALAACFLLSACAMRKEVGQVNVAQRGEHGLAIKLPRASTYWQIAFEPKAGLVPKGMARLSVYNTGVSDIYLVSQANARMVVSPGKSQVVFDGWLSELFKPSFVGAFSGYSPDGPLVFWLGINLSDACDGEVRIVATWADGP